MQHTEAARLHSPLVETRPAFPVRKVLAAATGVLLVMGSLVIFHGNVAPLTVRTTLSTNTYWSENTPAPTHAPVNSNTATSRMGAAFSGGGWRAQAASIGFAKALKDTGVMDTMDAMSSVSGGSWFTTQYSFSDKFHNMVNDAEPAEMYKVWLADYYTVLSPANSSDKTISVFESLCSVIFDEVDDKSLGQDCASLSSLLTGSLDMHFNWQDFISTSIDAFCDQHPPVSTLQAEPSNRVGGNSSNYDLVVQTSMPSQSQMDCEGHFCDIDPFGDLVKLESKQTGESIRNWVLPAAFVVPTEGAGYWKSPTPFHTLQVQVGTTSSVFGSHPTAPLNIPAPNVGKAASMSSAAAGALAFPNLIDQGVINKLSDAIGKSAADDASSALNIMDVLEHTGLQDMAVCSGETMSNCEFPSIRLLDGGYTDDSGIAMLVSHLQDKFGVGTPLGIIALDSDACTNTSDIPASCSSSAQYESRLLFSDDEKDQKEFNGTLEAQLALGIAGLNLHFPDKTIFDRDWTVSQFGTGLGADMLHQADHGMTFHRGVYHTIDNEKFGVRKGTAVTLTVVNINSVLSTIVVDEGLQVTDEYAQLAQNTYEVIKKAIEYYDDSECSEKKLLCNPTK